MRRVVVEALVWWAFALGLWCSFIGSITAPELVAGAAAGLVAALTIVQLRVLDWPAFRPALRWVAWLPTFVASALADTAGVFLGLWRWVVGGERDIAEFRTVRFGPPGDDSRCEAHRALGTVVVSATPGTFVIHTYRASGEARVHVFSSIGPDLLEEVGR